MSVFSDNSLEIKSSSFTPTRLKYCFCNEYHMMSFFLQRVQMYSKHKNAAKAQKHKGNRKNATKETNGSFSEDNNVTDQLRK